MNRPFMKVFTEERERTVLLCINAGAAMRFGTRGTFKSMQAARAAALLGWMAQARSNDRVGALVFGDVPDGMQFIPPARSRGPLWRTLKTLCRRTPPKNPKPVTLEDVLTRARAHRPDRRACFHHQRFPPGDRQTLEKTAEPICAGAAISIVMVGVQADPADKTICRCDGSGLVQRHGRQAHSGRNRQQKGA